MEENKTKEIISVMIPNIENELKKLKEQKDKLNILLDNIKKSRDEFIESQLSGKTYESSIRNNELFVVSLQNRINDLSILIDKLENACNTYNNYYANVNNSVVGRS